MVPRNKCTADIGTDHGFVPVSLVSEGIAERAIAADIGKGPLGRAETHVRRAGLTDRIECRLGDGLRVLSPGEAEVIVIAGMGGMLMVRILSEGIEVAKAAKMLILSPHRDACDLRKFLSEQSFLITDERMVQEDGKYYPVIRAEFRPEEKLPPLSEAELRFGPVLLHARPAVFLQYLEELRGKTEAEIRYLSAQKDSKAARSALKGKEADLSEILHLLGEEKTVSELKIRKMTEDDLEPLYELLSDPEVMRFLEPPFSEEQTASFLQKARLSDPPLLYTVEEDGRFIGYVIFHDFDEKSMEIGWVLREEQWGRGIASQLTRQLIEKGLSLGKDLVIECDPKQGATRRIALKNGFVYCGKEGELDLYRLRRLQT